MIHFESAKGMSEVAMLPDDDIPSLTSTSKAPSVNADMSTPLFSKKAFKQRKHVTRMIMVWQYSHLKNHGGIFFMGHETVLESL